MKVRMIYAMISVTLVLTIRNVILQQRKTLLKQRWEVMVRIIVRVQVRKDQITPIPLTNATIDLTRIMMTMKSLIYQFTILWNGIWEILY